MAYQEDGEQADVKPARFAAVEIRPVGQYSPGRLQALPQLLQVLSLLAAYLHIEHSLVQGCQGPLCP